MTLVEILIVLFLLNFFILFLNQLYINIFSEYRKQHVYFQMQSRFNKAFSILRTAIHNAGHIGCARLTKDFPIDGMPILSLENRFQGDSNAFQIRYMHFPLSTLSDMKPTSLIVEKAAIHYHDWMMISDCQKAEVFKVRNIQVANNKMILTPKQNLTNHFVTGAEVAQIKIERYFIAPTKRKNKDGSLIHSLYVQKEYQNKQEVVANIEKMHLHYFIKKNGKLIEQSLNYFLKWQDIVGVMVELTISIDGLKKQMQHFIAISNQSL